MGNDLNLALGDLGDDNCLAQLADAAVDLDLLVQELLKGRDVEDLVVDGLRGVDDELLGRLAGLAGLAGLLLDSEEHNHLSLLLHAIISGEQGSARSAIPTRLGQQQSQCRP